MGVKISDLTSATTPLTGTETFELVQSGESKSATLSQINNATTASQVGLGNVLNKPQLARDGSETATGDIPLGNFKLTQVGNATAGGDAVNRTTGDGRYVLQSSVDDSTLELTGGTLQVKDSGITDAKIGDRTVSDSTAPTGNTGVLTTLLGFLANQLKAITGKADWKTAPKRTLEDTGTASEANTGTDPTNVPTNADLGSAAYVNTGTGPTDVPQNSDLGSAAYEDVAEAATASTVAKRDASGRMKAADPASSGDVVNEGYFTANSVAASRAHVETRMSNLYGPVDSNGQPDALTFVASDISTNLASGEVLGGVITLGPRTNLRWELDSNVNWAAIATTEYAVVEVNSSGTVTGQVAIPGYYWQTTEPSSPSTGEVWYDPLHRAQPQEWDGAAWQDVLYSWPLGRRTGSGAGYSFAYGDEWATPWQDGATHGNSRTNIDNALGVSMDNGYADCAFQMRVDTAQAGYDAGTVIGAQGLDTTSRRTVVTATKDQVRLSNTGNLSPVNLGGGTGTVISTNYSVRAIVKRI